MTWLILLLAVVFGTAFGLVLWRWLHLPNDWNQP